MPNIPRGGVLCALLLSFTAFAADHLDGPAASEDPAADITDVFAWMSPDQQRVYLVMDLHPLANTQSRFSDAVQYVFHTQSRASFGDEPANQLDIICTFDADQRISCWAGDEYVNGDASGAAGLSSESGRLRVFAGLRDDPFFFNLDGFKKAVEDVIAAKSSLTFDAAGCPALDTTTSNALVTQLQRSPTGGPPTDFFANLNVLALVVSVDRSLVTEGGDLLSVWASTRRKP